MLIYLSVRLVSSTSLGISHLLTSRQQFHNHHGGEISGFRSLSRPFFFLSHVTPSRWRAAIRARTTMLFRRASSSIVNVFLLLHPSMPTALPSINISFHLSGSSTSTRSALPHLSRLRPVIFLDLSSPSHPSFSLLLPFIPFILFVTARVVAFTQLFYTGYLHLVPLSPCPRYFLQFAARSSARHHHRPLGPIDI